MSGERNIPRPVKASGVTEKSEAAVLVDHVNDLTGAFNGMTIAVSALETRQGHLEGRFDTFHSELSLIRSAIVDLTPRVGEVEKAQKTLPQKVGGVTVKGVSVLGIISLVLAIAAEIASVYRPKMVSPIKNIQEMVAPAPETEAAP